MRMIKCDVCDKVFPAPGYGNNGSQEYVKVSVELIAFTGPVRIKDEMCCIDCAKRAGFFPKEQKG